MKNVMSYLKTALILAIITSICGVTIALLNRVTSPIIARNNYDKEQEVLSSVYQGATFSKLDITIENEKIQNIYQAKEKEQTVGYVYLLSGKNAYGTIELMVGISDGLIKSIKTVTNTESYKSLVDGYINSLNDKDINYNNVSDLDVKCGATYGAKLVKELIEIALNHYQGEISNE